MSTIEPLGMVENAAMFPTLLQMQYRTGFRFQGLPQASVPLTRHIATGIDYLHALKYVVFPKTFETLPTELRKKLEDPKTQMHYDDFVKLISKNNNKRHFLPTTNVSYCQSWKEFLDTIEKVINSASLQKLSKAVCNEEPLEHLNIITTKPVLPAILYNILGSYIYYKEKISQQLLRVEFDRISTQIRNNDTMALNAENFLDDLCKTFSQAQISRRKKDDESLKEMEKVWEEVKETRSVDKLADYIFGDYQHPLKSSIKEQLGALISKSFNKTNTIRNILEDAELVKHFANTLYKKLPKKYTENYWDVELADLPNPIFTLRFVRPVGYVLPHTGGILQRQSFLFCSEIEQACAMNLRRIGQYKKNKHGKNWLKQQDSTRFFHYKGHNEALKILKEVGKVGKFEIQIPEEHMFTTGTCAPTVSPINTLCKPVHIILKDFVNFLNLELNIFRTIKDENIMDLKNYIKKFCEEFQVTKKSQFCVSWTDFEEFLETGRQLFADKLDENAEPKTMFIPTCRADFETLAKNVKPGILKFYDMAAVGCIVQRGTDDKKKMFGMANEAIYRAFVAELPELCQLIHNQRQCVDWNMCVFQIHPENYKLIDGLCQGGKSSDEFLCFEGRCFTNDMENEMENIDFNSSNDWK